MKVYEIGEAVTVSLMTGCFGGVVNGYSKSLSGEQLYKISGNAPKVFITTTSARLINTGEEIGMFSPKRCIELAKMVDAN